MIHPDIKNETVPIPSVEPVNETVPVAPGSFDYNAYRDQTTVQAITAIYKLLGEYAETLGSICMSNTTNEDIIKVMDEISQKTMMICVEKNVPDADMQFMMDKVQDNIFSAFNIISRQKSELEKEYMARCMGARNPGDGKLSREYASLGNLFSALKVIREEQDVNGNQYFHVKSE